MNRWLAFDIGCIECGEPSSPIGLYASEAEAQAASDAAEKEQQKDWHGQHYFAVFDLADYLLDSKAAAS